MRKITGDDDSPAAEKEKEEEEEKKQKRLKSLTPYAQSFQMFKDKQLLADVAIELDIKTDAVLDFYSDYLRLLRMHHLVNIYQDLKDNWSLFLHLYHRIKKEGLNKQEITDLIENEQRLVDLEQRVMLYKEFIKGQQLEKQQLEMEIDALRKMRDNFDGISPL